MTNPPPRPGREAGATATAECALIDGPVRFAGAVAVEAGPEGLQPWRLDAAARELSDPGLLTVAACPAGVRLRLRTDSSRLALEISSTPLPGYEDLGIASFVELVSEGVTRRSAVAPEGDATATFDDLDPGMHDIEVWLPTVPIVRVRRLILDDDARAEPPTPDLRPRWFVYGSSVTHGPGLAPTRTWPAVAGSLLDRNVTSLGFSGECHLDPVVARMIAWSPADHVTLELGVNIHIFATFRERTFAPAVHGFLDWIRDRKPDVPIDVVSPVASPDREHTARSTVVVSGRTEIYEGDLTLARMREILDEAVAIRRRHGDAHLRYVDGLALLGMDDVGTLPDGLHPDGKGHRLIAERFAAITAHT